MPFVNVWVDTLDIFDEVSDEDLRAEYRKRFLAEPESGDSMMFEAIERIERGDLEYGLYLLRQIASPKFASIEDCIRKLGNAKRL